MRDWTPGSAELRYHRVLEDTEIDMKNGIKIGVLAFFSALALMGTGCSSSEVPKKSDAAPVANAAAVSKLEGSLVRRPGNSVEDAKVYLVKGGKKCWVTSGEWLKQNGYKFPEDVKMISAEELDTMPVGDPIQ